MHPKDADGMANSVDLDLTASSEAVWSWSALFAETYLSQYIEFVRYFLWSSHLIIIKVLAVTVLRKQTTNTYFFFQDFKKQTFIYFFWKSALVCKYKADGQKQKKCTLNRAGTTQGKTIWHIDRYGIGPKRPGFTTSAVKTDHSTTTQLYASDAGKTYPV